jgi:hypothetical protein
MPNLISVATLAHASSVFCGHRKQFPVFDAATASAGNPASVVSETETQFDAPSSPATIKHSSSSATISGIRLACFSVESSDEKQPRSGTTSGQASKNFETSYP